MPGLHNWKNDILRELFDQIKLSSPCCHFLKNFKWISIGSAWNKKGNWGNITVLTKSNLSSQFKYLLDQSFNIDCSLFNGTKLTENKSLKVSGIQIPKCRHDLLTQSRLKFLLIFCCKKSGIFTRYSSVLDWLMEYLETLPNSDIRVNKWGMDCSGLKYLY